MTTIRLNHFLSQAGVCSRRQADDLIRSSRVTVNGAAASLGQKIDPQTDVVAVNQRLIKPQTEHLYILLHKPAGYVTTVKDELNRPTVMSLVPQKFGRLFPVGRLDIDSQGLLLLTNDGDLAYRLTHPSQHIDKTYHVIVEGRPTQKALHRLRTGLKLTDGFTAPAKVKVIEHDQDTTSLEVIIHEGKNRQVRRMFASVGYPVIELTRTALGPLTLDLLQDKPWIELNANHLSLLSTSP